MKGNHKLMQLGTRLRDLRLGKRLTQAELAGQAGFDRNYIGMLERGERNPSYLSLLKLADGLQIPLHEMLNSL